MLNEPYECKRESEDTLGMPLMQLQLPRIKTAIHKHKDWADSGLGQKKICLTLKKLHDQAAGPAAPAGPKRHLTITIPGDSEAKPMTPGSRVKSVSNYADTDEAGMFYGVTLKKGPYRRANEDRVLIAPFTPRSSQPTLTSPESSPTSWSEFSTATAANASPNIWQKASANDFWPATGRRPTFLTFSAKVSLIR